MAIKREDLRQKARTETADLTNAVKANINDAVVGTGKTRTIFNCKIRNTGTTDCQVILYRDGTTGSSVLDKISLPPMAPLAAGGTSPSTPCNVDMGQDIETPVYTLKSGE